MRLTINRQPKRCRLAGIQDRSTLDVKARLTLEVMFDIEKAHRNRKWEEEELTEETTKANMRMEQ